VLKGSFLQKRKKRTLVNVLSEKKRKKQIRSHSPGIPCVHFVLKGPGSRSIKKNQKRTLVNVLNEKKTKKKYSPSPQLPKRKVRFVIRPATPTEEKER